MPPASTSITPSGIEIAYWVEDKAAKVKRHYEIRQREKGDEDYWGESDSPWRTDIVSVTTALEVLDKPALRWWGMKVGVEGLIELCNAGQVRSIQPHREGPPGPPILAVPAPVGVGAVEMVAAGVDEIVELLKKHKLTVNDIKKAGGDRGQSCHDAFEIWANEGSKPDPDMFPPEERGYIIGLLQFIADIEVGEPEGFETEVMVGSLEHGYAGRYDVRFRTTKECAVAHHHTPVRGYQYAKLSPSRILGDVKTSKDVYPTSHFRQLEAYEAASIEDGYEETDARGVLNITADGRYKFVRSTASIEDFLCVLDVYRSNERLK